MWNTTSSLCDAKESLLDLTFPSCQCSLWISLTRMPYRVYIGLPNYDSRLLVLHGGMLGHALLNPYFDVNLLAKRTEGCSPLDIHEVLQAAALILVREAQEEAVGNNGGSGDDDECGDSTPCHYLHNDNEKFASKTHHPPTLPSSLQGMLGRAPLNPSFNVDLLVRRME
jgi:hypothetical protein